MGDLGGAIGDVFGGIGDAISDIGGAIGDFSNWWNDNNMWSNAALAALAAYGGWGLYAGSWTPWAAAGATGAGATPGMLTPAQIAGMSPAAEFGGYSALAPASGALAGGMTTADIMGMSPAAEFGGYGALGGAAGAANPMASALNKWFYLQAGGMVLQGVGGMQAAADARKDRAKQEQLMREKMNMEWALAQYNAEAGQNAAAMGALTNMTGLGVNEMMGGNRTRMDAYGLRGRLGAPGGAIPMFMKEFDFNPYQNMMMDYINNPPAFPERPTA